MTFLYFLVLTRACWITSRKLLSDLCLVIIGTRRFCSYLWSLSSTPIVLFNSIFMPWISLPTQWEEHFADFGQVREIKFLFWPPENEILFKIDDLWKIIPRNVSKIYELRNWPSCMVVESLVNMEKSVNKIQVRENLEKSGNFTEKNKSWNDTLLLEKTFFYI